MQFTIANRFTGKVQVTAEIDCADDAPRALKLGLAVKWAYKHGADLRGAYLRGADLRGADLRGAHLRGADLVGAHLRGADLVGADLRGADLVGADLRGADLVGANLGGADLGGAYLGGHKVAGGVGIVQAGIANGWSVIGFVDADTGALRVCAGCRNFTVPEGREYWSSAAHPNRDQRREVLAALDYIEAVARLRGWTTPE